MPIAKLPLIELLSSRSTAAFYDVVKPIERLDHGEPTPRLVDQVRSWERKQVDVVQVRSRVANPLRGKDLSLRAAAKDDPQQVVLADRQRSADLADAEHRVADAQGCGMSGFEALGQDSHHLPH